jgi:hypothetical protein
MKEGKERKARETSKEGKKNEAALEGRELKRIEVCS